ncbi:MAG: hypothetical protein WDW38_004408 [Sanguina aurantia]
MHGMLTPARVLTTRACNALSAEHPLPSHSRAKSANKTQQPVRPHLRRAGGHPGLRRALQQPLTCGTAARRSRARVVRVMQLWGEAPGVRVLLDAPRTRHREQPCQSHTPSLCAHRAPRSSA